MQFGDILALAGLRADGRGYTEARQLSYNLGSSLQADGSAYIEQGLNKVLVTICGPAEAHRRGADAGDERASIACHFLNSPFSGPDWRKRRLTDRKTHELETIVINTFEAVVMLETYPKSQIDITVDILESDGSLLCTVINGVTLALMDAGIAMADMVCSCSVGSINQQLILDLNQTEQNTASFFLPLAIKARTKEIIFMQMDSRLSVANLEAALTTGLQGCSDCCASMETAARSAMDPASAQL
jgi:exosome complex component RRP41